MLFTDLLVLDILRFKRGFIHADFLQKRGGLGILTLLSMEDGQRFTDLDEKLSISSSTLNLRLGEARGIGLVVPGMNTEETSMSNEYRITTRGKCVARRMENQGLTHAVRTILDYQQDVENEMPDLLEWIEANKETFEITGDSSERFSGVLESGGMYDVTVDVEDGEKETYEFHEEC